MRAGEAAVATALEVPEEVVVEEEGAVDLVQDGLAVWMMCAVRSVGAVGSLVGRGWW